MNTIWDLRDLMVELDDRFNILLDESRTDPEGFNYRNFNMLMFSIDEAVDILNKGLRQSKGEE